MVRFYQQHVISHVTILIESFVVDESNITLEFAESSLVREVLSQMSELQILYTVQIVPRTDQDSFEIFVFEKEQKQNKIFSGIKVFR